MRRRLFPGLTGCLMGWLMVGCNAGPDAANADEDSPSPTSSSSSPSTTAGETTSEPPDETGDEDEADDPPSSTGFIPMTDAGGFDQCDMWDPGGCGPGRKCNGYSEYGSFWDETRCVPLVEDPKQAGEPCTYDEGGFTKGRDDCDIGLTCWDTMLVYGKEVGVCIPQCTGAPENPTCPQPEDQLCNLTKAPIALCLPRCNPTQIDCPVGCTCIYGWLDGFLCLPDNSGDAGQYGDECQYASSCDPTLFCADAAMVPGCEGSQGCCSYFCNLDDPSTCTDIGTECIPWYEEGMAPPGYENVGGCGIPE